MRDRTTSGPTASGPIPFKYILAVIAGNGLEFYNFLTYSLFAVYIGRAFFPTHSNALSLLLSLAAFAVGFVPRPFGAIILGRLGDRIGRRPALLLSFLLMAIGVAGMALTPTYAQIGTTAPLLIVFFRLVQGFALGGEIGPATAFIIEAAPPSRRGLYGVLQGLSANCAVLAAALVALGLSGILSSSQLAAWGWRIALLCGLAIVPFGLLMRRNLPETFRTTDKAAQKSNAMEGALPRSLFRNHWRLILICFSLMVAGTTGSYTINYMTTFALDTLHMRAGIAFGVLVVAGIVQIPTDLVAGLLSDRFGRKPLLLYPFIAAIILVFPGFWVIVHFHTILAFYGVVAIITIPMTLAGDTVVIALAEGLPRQVRSGVVGTVYALAISIFGGSTQFFITVLLKLLRDPLAPAYYWSFMLALGIVAALFLHESAPRKTDQLRFRSEPGNM